MSESSPIAAEAIKPRLRTYVPSPLASSSQLHQSPASHTSFKASFVNESCMCRVSSARTAHPSKPLRCRSRRTRRAATGLSGLRQVPCWIGMLHLTHATVDHFSFTEEPSSDVSEVARTQTSDSQVSKPRARRAPAAVRSVGVHCCGDVFTPAGVGGARARRTRAAAPVLRGPQVVQDRDRARVAAAASAVPPCSHALM